MVSGKRKFQENATQPHKVSYERDELDRLTELALHVDLRLHEAKRIGLPKVRLEMIEAKTAQALLKLLRSLINGYL
jgi:hypothetical protein